MNVAVGIDLGTTNSCVAIVTDGEAEILRHGEDPFIPSCVAFDRDRVLVGQEALDHLNPKNKIYGIKNIIGLKYDDAKRIAKFNQWPFTLTQNGDVPQIQVDYKSQQERFCPEEISAIVMSKLKNMVQRRTESSHVSAVITVPTGFSSRRRAATEAAAKVAGIEVLQLINESTAAAIAFSALKKQMFKRRKKVLVFDLGGGTLDTTIIEVNGNNVAVKGCGGDLQLGGDDFTRVLIEEVDNQIEMTTDEKHKKMLKKIRNDAEAVKKRLSFNHTERINIDGDDETFTRAELDIIFEELYDRTMHPVNEVLANAEVRKSEIDLVLLAGGSVKIPYIKRQLEVSFGRDKVKFLDECDQLVAKGAAILASHCSGTRDRTLKRLNFKNVTPIAVGTDIDGMGTSIVLPRNKILPARKTTTYVKENMSEKKEFSFQICQGEKTNFDDNDNLGNLTFPIKPQNNGVVKIEVTVAMDKSGLLRVTAKQKGFWNEAKKSDLDTTEYQSNETIAQQKTRLKNMKLDVTDMETPRPMPERLGIFRNSIRSTQRPDVQEVR